jgi:hypothetical protein
MSYDVRQISQIDTKNIKLGKTFKYGDNYHLTNIYYLPTIDASIPKETDSRSQNTVDEKTKLIIQTPLMYIPNSMVYFNEKPFLELSFNNEENDKDVLVFKKWILDLEEYIYKLIKKRTTLKIEKQNINSILKNGYGKSSSVSRLIVPINMNVSKCILNVDNKKTKFLFNWEISVPTYAISIVWVKNIWIKNGKWGVNLFMYASRVMNSHILDPIDFMGMDGDNKSIKISDVNKKFKDDEKMSIQVGQIPEYTMFFKMLKMGIPKEAVKQKMSLLSLDTRYIDYPSETSFSVVLHYISNPQLGTYVKPKNGGTGNIEIGGSVARPNINIGGLLNSINVIGRSGGGIGGGFKLKKVNLEENQEEKNKARLLMKVNTGMKVPSLGDIQGALSRLKKIEIDNDNEESDL